jgi:hypothetical protein
MAYTTINKGSSYFNTVIYTGNNGASQSITGVGFQPDFVWIKNRTDARNHVLTDIVRGATKTLFSQSDIAEVTNPTDGYLSSFGSDGFSVSQGSVNNENVCATDNYVSWNWLANNTSGSSNTAGTITSTVAANTTAGFSIVSYTGTGSNATVGHGLGVAPDFLIIKNRTGTNSWPVWSRSYGNAGVMYLDLTNTPPDTNPVFLNGTTPTSSVFSIGTAGHVNASASNYIAYVFNSVKGFSKFGKYTGNSSTDGTFIYTGFKPAFILIKRSDSNDWWGMWDSKRLGYNGSNYFLRSNTADVEANKELDILSNGFKIRTVDGGINASGGTYIYMCFAENPFVTSTQIPTTAR